MSLSFNKNTSMDPAYNKFKKTNLFYTTDEYLLYQDPTWLGFKLLFLFNQPDSRLLSAPIAELSTPGNSPNREIKPIPNTAYNYLMNIGETSRALLLAKFVNHLKEINERTPWFFQTIEGLSDAWKRGYQDDNFKAALPKDRKIKINCLESIDLRMSALMDLYRKACFDWKYRREIVPFNLRTFTVYIYVYELRNINRTGKPSPSGLLDFSRQLGLPDTNIKQQRENERLLGEDPFKGSNPKDSLIERASSTINEPITAIKNLRNSSFASGNEKANTINPNINRFLFKFSYCEWLPDESSVGLDKISSIIGDGDSATQSIAFSYQDVEEQNLYNIYSGDQLVSDAIIRILDNAASDNPLLTGRPQESYGLQDLVNPSFQKLLPFATLAVDQAERFASSLANKLLLGNIYGFSPATAASTANGILSGDPNEVLTGARTINDRLLNKSISNSSRDFPTGGLGNIYENT